MDKLLTPYTYFRRYRNRNGYIDGYILAKIHSHIYVRKADIWPTGWDKPFELLYSSNSIEPLIISDTLETS